MAELQSGVLRRPLYIFDLPPELLITLQLRDQSTVSLPDRIEPNPNVALEDGGTPDDPGKTITSTSCLLCSATFPNVLDQRQHARSDWHNYNIKQKIKSRPAVSEDEFEKLIGDLDESLSGSESESSGSEDDRKETALSALLKKQAKISQSGNEDQKEIQVGKKRKRGAGKPPLLWFSSPLIPSNTSLGVYRAVFTEEEQREESDILEVLRRKQLPQPEKKHPPSGSNGVPLPSTMTSPSYFLCMIGGGHFAAMIVSLAPKMNKKPGGGDERQAVVIAHKTFHRYTTRRKQGGAQSANDSAKGAAHSAGAGIRRHNEVALEAEIRALLGEWRELISSCQLIFTRATGTNNRRTLFGPYEGQVLEANDARNRSFPFSTRRATQAELMRAFVELTRMKVLEVDEAALAAVAAVAEKEAQECRKNEVLSKTPKPQESPKRSRPKEDEAALMHTTQLQSLIRRSKVPALLSYLSTNSLSPDFPFHPPNTQANHHAPTSLHLASSINSPAVVHALLTKAHANPTIFNAEGKPPFDLAGDRPTRDAFRVARSQLGEQAWDWGDGGDGVGGAHCPPPLSQSEANQRHERERAGAEAAKAVEAKRRMEDVERLQAEEEAKKQKEEKEQRKRVEMRRGVGKTLLGSSGEKMKTGAEKREEEARGLTPEMRMRLERERRARAAEERIRRMAGGGGRGEG